VSAVEDPAASVISIPGVKPSRCTLWALSELAISYALIMAVIWTSRPLQRWLYWTAIAWFVFSIVWSFPGWKAMGCTVSGFWRSAWIVAVALGLAATAALFASDLHTLHHPSGLTQWVLAFGGYTVWSLAQQFLLQGYFLTRLTRLIPSATLAAVIAAGIFAMAHLPNPILTVLTLIWGTAACLVFLKVRNIWTLGLAHAIFGICVAVTIPAATIHNMRVGRGYLTYHAPRHSIQRSQSDHKVSTVAWVMDEAPTRR
jgi:membrane protease YdiL (CAAX protease family)